MIGPGWDEPRYGHVASAGDELRTARSEATLTRGIEWNGYCAVDGLEPIARVALYAGNGLQKQLSVRVLWRVEDLSNGSTFHNPA